MDAASLRVSPGCVVLDRRPIFHAVPHTSGLPLAGMAMQWLEEGGGPFSWQEAEQGGMCPAQKDSSQQEAVKLKGMGSDTRRRGGISMNFSCMDPGPGAVVQARIASFTGKKIRWSTKCSISRAEGFHTSVQRGKKGERADCPTPLGAVRA